MGQNRSAEISKTEGVFKGHTEKKEVMRTLYVDFHDLRDIKHNFDLATNILINKKYVNSFQADISQYDYLTLFSDFNLKHIYNTRIGHSIPLLKLDNNILILKDIKNLFVADKKIFNVVLDHNDGNGTSLEIKGSGILTCILSKVFLDMPNYKIKNAFKHSQSFVVRDADTDIYYYGRENVSDQQPYISDNYVNKKLHIRNKLNDTIGGSYFKITFYNSTTFTTANKLKEVDITLTQGVELYTETDLISNHFMITIFNDTMLDLDVSLLIIEY